MVKAANASHILITNARDAQGIMIRLSKGENFEDLAKRFSKCPSASKGGNLGWFKKGDMVPEFEKAVFEGQPGEIVGPVKSQFGYHIIRINQLK